MWHGPFGHHAGAPWAHYGSCCCGPFHHGPPSWSKEEQAAALERYLESLREEEKAVEKTIAELKAET
jgi:hypothetical protein